jgi:hypothetical protein
MVKGAVAEYLSRIGRKGGKISGQARMQNLTPEQRREIAKKAAAARWKDYVAKRPASSRKKEGA